MAKTSRQPTREQKFMVLLANAMTRPMSAAVVAITLIVGLTVSYWFFAVGAAFYALLVYLSLRDADESKRVLNEVLYPGKVRKLDLTKLTGAYRGALERALDTRRRIESAVQATDDQGVRKVLADSTSDLGELTGTIYDIAVKAQDLQKSFDAARINVSGLNEDIRRLEKQVGQTTDEFARGQYQATLDGKRQQLQNYHETQGALARWQAQLDNALSTLDTILTQVLRIRSSEVLSLSSATDEVSRSLREEVEALKATSDALDTVYGSGR